MFNRYATSIIAAAVIATLGVTVVGCGRDTSVDSAAETTDSELITEEILFPEKYSLIDEKRVTPYKNQHQSGMCWAYTTTAVAESALITAGFEGEDVDLSEGHVCYTFYSYAEDREEGSSEDGIYVLGEKKKILLNPYYAGGNPIVAMYRFAAGAGPIYEEEFPIDTDAGQLKKSVENAMKLEAEGKIQKNMGKYLLTEYDVYESDEDIKYGLMNRGAVAIGVSMNENGLGLNSNNEACYYYTDATNPPESTNHVVTIVGWDDTYSKDNFGKVKPNNDGAWLVKDSLSSNLNYRNTGYYWLSYDEYHMGNTAARFAKREDYGTVLSYDGMMLEEAIKTEGEYTVTANCFTVEADNAVNAVGVCVCNPKQKMDIEIYLNPEADRPDSGEAVYTDSVIVDFVGYKVIDLGEAIDVKAGDRIGVVVRYHNIEGQSKIAPVEGDTNYINLGSLGELYITSKPGESYALKDGIWYDLSDAESAGVFGKAGIINNARIKLLLSK